jgi:hypothetical protein
MPSAIRYTFEAEAHLNNIERLSPYLKENTTPLNYKNQLINAF